MEESGIPLFSQAALAVLDRQPYDPAAKGEYELMSGGLVWRDEFPRSPEWELVSQNITYRFLVAHRADLTLGEVRIEFRAVWEQVLHYAPNWPGLRRNDAVK